MANVKVIIGFLLSHLATILRTGFSINYSDSWDTTSWQVTVKNNTWYPSWYVLQEVGYFSVFACLLTLSLLIHAAGQLVQNELVHKRNWKSASVNFTFSVRKLLKCPMKYLDIMTILNSFCHDMYEAYIKYMHSFEGFQDLYHKSCEI